MVGLFEAAFPRSLTARVALCPKPVLASMRIGATP